MKSKEEIQSDLTEKMSKINAIEMEALKALAENNESVKKYIELLQDLSKTLMERYTEEISDHALTAEDLKSAEAKEQDLIDKLMFLQAQVNDYKIQERIASKKEMNLNFTALTGDIPLLWIQTKGNEVDQASLSNLCGAIKSQCKNVELIVVTTDNVNLTSLSEEDLNNLGLARIAGQVKTLPDSRSCG